jgi:phosphatidate cytidylyltransferase
MFAVVLAASLAGLWEFSGLFPSAGPGLRGLSLALGAVMSWLGFRYGPGTALAVPLAAYWLEELARLAPGWDRSPRWLLAASLLYVPGSLQFLTSFGPGETALVLASVMATDTGAYYSGHAIGGPKVWPAVSPKKTWAGCVGGLAATVAVCLVAGRLWGRASLPAFALLGVLLSISAQMGDFMESSLKRAAGVKDSGNLLPGHGGFLDRMDGLLPAILIYALARGLVKYL